MSIEILTLKEAKKTKEACVKYGEVYEEKVGRAPRGYICDHSGVEIQKGEECAAVLVLPSRDHPNYENQLDMLGWYVLEPSSNQNLYETH